MYFFIELIKFNIISRNKTDNLISLTTQQWPMFVIFGAPKMCIFFIKRKKNFVEIWFLRFVKIWWIYLQVKM